MTLWRDNLGVGLPWRIFDPTVNAQYYIPKLTPVPMRLENTPIRRDNLAAPALYCTLH